MPSNYLVTGPPQSGKTTVIENTVERLEALGVAVGGLYSPEIRVDGERVGFELVDVATRDRTTMAHVDYEDGPAVGTYRIDTDAVDEFASRALANASERADLVVVDEIAPMQLHSTVFVDELARVLDSRVSVLAAIQFESEFDFVEEIKHRRDVRLYKVTPETRETLPERLARQIGHREGE